MKTPTPKMRKFATVLVAAFAASCIAVGVIQHTTHRATPVDEETFPDEGLRTYVSEKVDTNGDGELSVEEAAKLTSMHIGGVRDLTGLDHFPNLQSVTDADGTLESVDLSGCASLITANFSGAKNLTSLTLGKNANLEELHVRATGISELDLGGAGSLKILECNTDTTVANAPRRAAQMVTNYVEETTTADGTSSFSVQASYDDQNRLVGRTFTGDIDAEVNYEYDECGRPTKVSVESADSSYANVWDISYGENGLDMHAAGTGDTHIDKTYDELGREKELSVKASGLSGEVDETMEFTYGVTGLLDTVTVTTTDGAQTAYRTSYNTEGNLIALNSAEDAYTFNTGRGTPLENVAAPFSERHGTDTLVRDYVIAGKDSRRISELAETLFSDDGVILSRTYGTYSYDDNGLITYGNVLLGDGAATRDFDVTCEQAQVDAVSNIPFTSAVDFRYLTAPSVSVDYWLLDTPEWLLNQEVEAVVMAQDVSSLATWNDKHHDRDNYYGTTDLYAGTIDALDDGALYAYADIDGDDSAELLVSPSGRTDDISAIYTLAGEEPVASRLVEDGETLALAGDGFILAAEPDGSVRLEHFNGATFDTMTTAVAGSDDVSAYAREYRPISGIDWE